jgi:hypothetical protein
MRFRLFPGVSLRHRAKENPNPEPSAQAGGFSTKINLSCNAIGLFIGVVLSERQAHDITAHVRRLQSAAANRCSQDLVWLPGIL